MAEIAYIALETIVYLVIGLVIMMIGYLIINLIIPVDFPREINEGNKSVGWVSAGIYMGLGFVIRSAIISNIPEIESDILTLPAIGETVIYALIGIVTFIVGYFVVDIINRKFNFNVALKEKNEAAGIMIFGIFIGMAFVVSGVIQ